MLTLYFIRYQFLSYCLFDVSKHILFRSPLCFLLKNEKRNSNLALKMISVSIKMIVIVYFAQDMQILNKNFDQQKSQCLQKVDLSRKGSVDSPIEILIAKINSQNDFFTTSSCSGRLALMAFGEDKRSCKFYMNSHEPINFDQLSTAIHDSDVQDSLVLKFEPFILHVQCRSLESANILHKLALDCGFRNSGLTLGKMGKVTLAIRSTLGLETPLGSNRAELTVESYLNFLVTVTNEKFAQNERLKTEFEKSFCDKFCNS